MKIQGIDIPDEEIFNAYGSWKRDDHCIIAIEIYGRKYSPFIFTARSSTEANKMQKLLNQAVSIAQKNQKKR